MWKAWTAAIALAAAGSLILVGAVEPDIFADGKVTFKAVPSHGAGPAAAISCFTGDQYYHPQMVFYPGNTICWWSQTFVVPKGIGPVQESITVVATTPKRSTTFTGSFTICNTSNPSTCDDIPSSTSWALGICSGQLPTNLNKILQRTGPVPFDSAISGTGYVSYSANLTGNSVAPLP